MISISHLQWLSLKIGNQLFDLEQVSLMHITSLSLSHQVSSTFVSSQVTFTRRLEFELPIPTRSNLNTCQNTILILFRSPLWFFNFCLGFLTLTEFNLFEWCLLLLDFKCPFILVSLLKAGSNSAFYLCLSNNCINAKE